MVKHAKQPDAAVQVDSNQTAAESNRGESNRGESNRGEPNRGDGAPLTVRCAFLDAAVCATRCLNCPAFVGWRLSTAAGEPAVVCRHPPDDDDDLP